MKSFFQMCIIRGPKIGIFLKLNILIKQYEMLNLPIIINIYSPIDHNNGALIGSLTQTLENLM